MSNIHHLVKQPAAATRHEQAASSTPTIDTLSEAFTHFGLAPRPRPTGPDRFIPARPTERQMGLFHSEIDWAKEMLESPYKYQLAMLALGRDPDPRILKYSEASSEAAASSAPANAAVLKEKIDWDTISDDRVLDAPEISRKLLTQLVLASPEKGLFIALGGDIYRKSPSQGIIHEIEGTNNTSVYALAYNKAKLELSYIVSTHGATPRTQCNVKPLTGGIQNIFHLPARITQGTAIATHGNWIACGGKGGLAILNSTQRRLPAKLLAFAPDDAAQALHITRCAFSPDGDYLFAATTAGDLLLWKYDENGKKWTAIELLLAEQPWKAQGAYPTALLLTEKLQRLYVGDSKGGITVMKNDYQTARARIQSEPTAIIQMTLAASQKHFIVLREHLPQLADGCTLELRHLRTPGHVLASQQRAKSSNVLTVDHTSNRLIVSSPADETINYVTLPKELQTPKRQKSLEGGLLDLFSHIR